MWFGTSGGGINKYHGQQFQHYTTISKKGFLHDYILFSVLGGSPTTPFGQEQVTFGFAEMRNDSVVYHNQNTDFHDHQM